jgi:hypothetical protein
MTIAQSITALNNAKEDIFDAITEKGGLINEGDGFEDFADAIRTINPPIPQEYGLVTFTAVVPTAAVIMIS